MRVPPSAAGREWRAVLVVADSRWDKKAAPLHLPQYDWYQYGGLLRPVVLSEVGPQQLVESAVHLVRRHRPNCPPGASWGSGRSHGRPSAACAAGRLGVAAANRLRPRQSGGLSRFNHQASVSRPSRDP